MQEWRCISWIYTCTRTTDYFWWLARLTIMHYTSIELNNSKRRPQSDWLDQFSTFGCSLLAQRRFHSSFDQRPAKPDTCAAVGMDIVSQVLGSTILLGTHIWYGPTNHHTPARRQDPSPPVAILVSHVDEIECSRRRIDWPTDRHTGECEGGRGFQAANNNNNIVVTRPTLARYTINFSSKRQRSCFVVEVVGISHRAPSSQTVIGKAPAKASRFCV